MRMPASSTADSMVTARPGRNGKATGPRIVDAEDAREGRKALDALGSTNRKPIKGSGGFLLESDLGTTKQAHRNSSLFSNFSGRLLQREHKRKTKQQQQQQQQQHATAADEVDGTTSTIQNPRSIWFASPSTMKLSSAAVGTPGTVIMRDGDDDAEEGERASAEEANPIRHDASHAVTRPIPPRTRAPPFAPVGQGHTAAPLTGWDLDSARIINLALNLNETRRRSVNLGQASPRPAVPHGRRAVSTAKPAAAWNSMDGLAIHGVGGNNLKEHLQKERRPKRHISAATSASSRPSRPSEDAAPKLPPSPTTGNVLGSDDGQDFEYHFSKSTLARAEKAMVALELAFEYRRLLQYLAPLKPRAHPLSSANSTAPSSPTVPLSKVHSSSTIDDGEGRAYNPLQCIRNRKVRARERRALDPVAEGWGDLTKVKAWVDEVREGSGKASLEPSHRDPLPPFPSAQLYAAHAQPASVSGLPQRDHAAPTRWRRPRMDWQLTPEDLLADAYWTEHGDHKDLIEDRYGNRIFASEPQMEPIVRRRSRRIERFTKIRKDASVRNSLASDDGLTNIPSSSLQAEPRDVNIHDGHPYHTGKGRGAERTPGRRRGSDTRSISSSDLDSRRQGMFGARKTRHRRDNHSLEELDSALLEKQMLSMLRKEAEEGETDGSTKAECPANPNAVGRDRQAKGASAPSNMPDGVAIRGRGPEINVERARMFKPLRQSESPLPYLHESPVSYVPDATGLSADEVDTTATNSPQVHSVHLSSDSVRGLVPSLALNLSPPHSRRPSDGKDALDQVKKDLERHDIGATDFAAEDEQKTITSEALQRVLSISASPEKHKGFSPLKKLGSRKTEDTDIEEGMSSAVRVQSIRRDHRHPELSRIRGILRGGRIEEVLRNEVSRIGDLFWRRDSVSDTLAVSPASSRRDSGPLESEDDGQAIDKHLTNGTTQSAASIDQGSLSQKPTRSAHTKYHMDGLPTFTSCNAGNGMLQPARGVTELDGPAAQRRTDQEPISSKASTLSLLTSPDLSRTDTRTSGSLNIDPRYDFRGRSKSPGRFPTREVRDADSKLNSIIATRGRMDAQQRPGVGASRLHSVDRLRASKRASIQTEGNYNLSEPQPGVSEEPNSPQIARVRALLLSSGVKAQEIVQQTTRMETVAPFTDRAAPCGPPLIVPHDARHMVVAQILSKEIDHDTRLVEGSIQELTEFVAPDLLKEIARLQDHLTSKLIPEVRAYADEADGLSTELTTTHILAVKQANDSIDLLMRSRRRRFRWIRRGGYVMLEWVLLGLMWWAWLIVVLIRMVRVTISGILTGVRWMLWL